MKINKGFAVGFCFGVAFTGLLVLFLPEYTKAYTKGQIDALSGKVVVYLKENSDGSRQWERSWRNDQ